jgi:hypothetical protein
LNLLPIPDRPWRYISIDFVISLPLSESKNVIFVVVNRLIKEYYFIPCFAREKGISAKETTRMIICYIYLLYRQYESAVLDQGV